MFKRDKRKSKSTRIDTLIGQHTHIKGDISFSGGLRVDGSIAGNIHATGDKESVLTLSEMGAIEGEVRVPNLVVNGTITGNVFASEHIELAPKAKVQGNVYYNLLEMAMGSAVNGQMIHINADDEQILDIEHQVVDDTNNFQLEQKDESQS
ncbi:cell shape determination protein CcmA [Methylophaga sp. 42_8_T64]|nr:cell shape determination protein CcmA [Methylophaga sp. 41_12_T18]OUR87025.1 cell shape determination protein CcmA [Methylophaga sp. 42_8_T64]